jgi:hypothetical protein
MYHSSSALGVPGLCLATGRGETAVYGPVLLVYRSGWLLVHHNGGNSFDLLTRSDHAYETRLLLSSSFGTPLRGSVSQGHPYVQSVLITRQGITETSLATSEARLTDFAGETTTSFETLSRPSAG